ncbi:MAG: HAD family hydrolase [Myxococcota bacterium]
MIRAVTLDFWDTLVVEAQSHAARLARQTRRRRMFVDEIRAHHPNLDQGRVSVAYAEANAWAARRWMRDQVTPTVPQRLAEGYRRLGLPLTPGFVDLSHRYESVVLDTLPALAPGVADGLHALSAHVKLGIIADTLFTPGRIIRQILDTQGLLPLFAPDAILISDEVGCAKPCQRMFDAAATALGAPPPEMVHVGDRENTDILGAQRAGLRAVLYVGVIDRDGDGTSADAICRDFRDLPELIAAW